MIRHVQRIALDEACGECVALSPDGAFAAVCLPKSIAVFRCSDGTRLQRISMNLDPTGLSFSQDGKRLAVAAGEPKVALFEPGSGVKIQEIGRSDAPDYLRKDVQRQVQFFPGAERLLTTGTRNMATILDVEQSRWEHIFWTSHTQGMIAISPGGQRVALASLPNSNEFAGHLTVYRVHGGLQPLWTGFHSDERRLAAVNFSSDEQRVVTTSRSDGVRVWQTEDGHEVAHITRPDAEYLAAAFAESQDRLLIVTSRSLECWDIRTGRTLARSNSVNSGEFQCVSFGGGRRSRTILTGAKRTLDLWSYSSVSPNNRSGLP